MGKEGLSDCLPQPPDMHRRNDPPESCKMESAQILLAGMEVGNRNPWFCHSTRDQLLHCLVAFSRLLLPPALFMMIVVSLPLRLSPSPPFDLEKGLVASCLTCTLLPLWVILIMMSNLSYISPGGSQLLIIENSCRCRPIA